jgi:hypothetical protein
LMSGTRTGGTVAAVRSMEFRSWVRSQCSRDGRALDLCGQKQRGLLALLLLEAIASFQASVCSTRSGRREGCTRRYPSGEGRRSPISPPSVSPTRHSRATATPAPCRGEFRVREFLPPGQPDTASKGAAAPLGLALPEERGFRKFRGAHLGNRGGMLAVALAAIVVGIVFLFILPWVGVPIGVVGLVLLGIWLVALIRKSPREAAEEAGPP